MRINFISRFFKPKMAQKTVETLQSISLAQKAEQRLQSRLTDWHTLMKDVRTGDILDINTGKKFTGKYTIKTDDAMKHEFSVQQMIKNGTSTFIGSRGY